MRTKVLASVIALVLLMSGSVLGAEKVVLKVAHDSPTSHPYQKTLETFKAILESEAKGAIEVQIFPDAQLGDEPKLIRGIRQGTIDAAPTGSINLSAFVPEAELFNLPLLFRDIPHMYKVLDGPIGQRVAKSIAEKTDSVVLGWFSAGTRIAWNSKRPIQTPADFRGIKMRVPPNPIMLDTFNAFGAQATTVAFAELYQALQQGVVDGADNDVVDILSFKFYEVTKYVSLTDHLNFSTAFLFSKKRYAQLSPELREAVLKAGRAAVPVARKAQEDIAKGATEQLKQRGLIFNSVDQKPFRDAVQVIYEKYAEKVGGLQAIQGIINQ